jgi:hypothetical protein
VIAWMIFTNPLTLSVNSGLMFLLPLCAAVAIIYKTIRVDDLRYLAREIVSLVAYMVAGLVVLCIGLWLIHTYWP